ncbi:ubiquitin-like protein [Trypanosoma theileri]|uniref:Ubiquitin-like protein n=1 Tax=Trypanosoma theileri TaxID=67003 RepID=A0A1X0P8J6_9TRYP|nr:ubiquitin-like protein [Trypanosoma theileri]ORC93155.1 ubiquitin-like protein [Trypanosoma theileri]
MSVTVKLSNGTQKTIEIPDLGITVAKFKEMAAAATEIPAEEQRVVLRGRVLKDGDILSAVGMEHGQALHIVRGKSTAKATTSSTTTQSTAESSGQQTSSNSQTRSEGNNPYMSLAGSQPPTGGAPMNSFMNPGLGFQMSPEHTVQMLQNPVFSQYVQEMMGNPQLMQQLMQGMSSGQTDNSHMGMQSVLNNPVLLQHTMQLMSNPAFMQQMMQMMNSGSPGQNSPFLGQTNTQLPNPLMSAGFPSQQGDPRVIYQSQLQQLREMGFPNEEANLAALQQAQGNLDFAIERLLNA